MSQKRNDRGFTLVELIIVIAILAVLVAVTVPALSGYVAKAQKSVCQTNRVTLTREIAAAELAEQRQLTDKEIKALMENHGDVCPKGGTITLSRGADGLRLGCSVHDELPPAILAALKVTDNFDKLDPSKYPWGQNSKLFEEYYATHKAWEQVVIDGVTYYAKPYYNDATKEMVVFANQKQDATQSWTASLVFHDGQWYRYTNKWGNQNSAISIVNRSWDELVTAVKTEGGTLEPVDLT